jgi:Flp pilus assembly protein TadD
MIFSPRTSMKFSSRTVLECAIALATGAAYANSLAGGFVYLDGTAILDNPTIRDLANLRRVLAPPSAGGATVGGRPLLNLSLAVNYALGGIHPWGYHLVNLLIHLAGALTLFGLVRRTLLRVGWVASESEKFAFVAALAWAVHPLQTESVTYVVQRAESLMGLFYLLTLYGFARGAGEAAGDRRGWLTVSWLACLGGMATKEVMVSAPLIVLAYDRTFVAGSFAEAWRRRRGYFLALALTWVVLLGLFVAGGGNRGGTAGFNLGFSWWGYVRTQFPAVLHYLRLACWPHPLRFYSTPWPSLGTAEVWRCGAAVAALAAAAAIAFWRRSALGLLGSWFFALLAPTSLVPGMSQTMAEHRMYLALVPVLVVLLLAWRRLCSRLAPRRAGPIFLGLGLGWCAALAVLTVRRNAVYRDEITLWADTAAKSPDNPFAANNLGVALAAAGRPAEAVAWFERALRLRPDYPDAENNLGLSLAGAGRPAEARAHYERALDLKPDFGQAEMNLGVALASQGRMEEAVRHFQRAAADEPTSASAHGNLASSLARLGRVDEAIAEYRAALALQATNAELRFDLGSTLAAAGRWQDAVVEFERAVNLGLNSPEAHANLGASLANLGRFPEAIAHYERALALSPGDPDLHYNLALALRALGRESEARAQFETAERLRKGPAR